MIDARSERNVCIRSGEAENGRHAENIMAELCCDVIGKVEGWTGGRVEWYRLKINSGHVQTGKHCAYRWRDDWSSSRSFGSFRGWAGRVGDVTSVSVGIMTVSSELGIFCLCLYVCLCVCLLVWLRTYLPVWLAVNLSACCPLCLGVCLCLHFCLTACKPEYLPRTLATYTQAKPTTYLPTYLPTPPTTYLHIYLPASRHFCLSV